MTSVVEEYLAATKALGGTGTLREAAEGYRRRHAEGGSRPAVTVATLREEYRQNLVSLERNEEYIKKTCGVYLANFVRTFGSATIANLTTADLKRWWKPIPGAGKTRNNYRNAVEALFSFARAQHYLPRKVDTEASFLVCVRLWLLISGGRCQDGRRRANGLAAVAGRPEGVPGGPDRLHGPAGIGARGRAPTCAACCSMENASGTEPMAARLGRSKAGAPAVRQPESLAGQGAPGGAG